MNAPDAPDASDASDAPSAPDGAGLADALVRVLAPAGVATIHAVTQLSGGASRETFAVEVGADGGAAKPLVVQLARTGNERSMVQEATVLRAAAAAGVPVAGVVDASDDTAALGAAYLVLDHVAGETIARRILRDDAFAGARRVLAGQVGQALGRLHRIDPATLAGLERLDPLAHYRQVLDGLGQPHPAFELAFRWLERTRPPTSGRLAVVHGDARLGNLIVDGSGLAALIDWELAHVGDPIEDLGWLCARPWRFGGPLPVGGFGTYDDLLDAYAEASGTVVDVTTLRWWEAVGSLTWGIICIAQADAHRSGRRRSHELAAIGRRVCETEHDLLSMMPSSARYRTTVVGRSSDAPADVADRAAPHDVPTMAELVEAVREWIEHDVLPATAGRLRFHARVAAGMLATVERELALGPVQAVDHRERLANFGCRSDAELAACIRSGDLDDREAELRGALLATVADKLAVANPRYREG